VSITLLDSENNNRVFGFGVCGAGIDDDLI
jgi:hypothetical protein